MESKEKPAGQKNWQPAYLKKLAIGAGILIAVFFLGYIPSCISARTAQELSARMEQKLRLAEMLSRLGMASYEANRNNYASATQMSTEFFNSLKQMTDTTKDEALKQKLQSLSVRRDEITTNLAQADPAVKEKLGQLYADLFQVTRGLSDDRS
jgi:hypothetical protein